MESTVESTTATLPAQDLNQPQQTCAACGAVGAMARAGKVSDRISMTSKQQTAPTSAPRHSVEPAGGILFRSPVAGSHRTPLACADSDVPGGTFSGGAQVTMTYHGTMPSERSKVTLVESLLGAAMVAAELDDS